MALFLLMPAATQAAQVCVERSEDQGSVNIYPVDVMLGGRKLFSLNGGDKNCAVTKDVAETVWVRWPTFDWNRPDHGIHNKQISHSPRTVLVVLEGGERTDLKVCGTREQGAAPAWHIGGDGLGDCR